MARVITAIFALFVGMFTLIMSLILAIPLTIAAIFAGKRLQRSAAFSRTEPSANKSGNTIEGDYEEVQR